MDLVTDRPAGSRPPAPARLTDGRWAPLLTHGVRPLLVAGDLAACATAALITDISWVFSGALAGLLLVAFTSAGVYRSRLSLSMLDDLPRLSARWLIASAVLLVLTQLVGPGVPVLELAALAGVGVLAARTMIYATVRNLRRVGWVAHSTIVLGADEVGREIVEAMNRHREAGLRPLGFLDSGLYDATQLPAPLLGISTELAAVLAKHQPRVLIVATGAMDEDELVDQVRACHRQSCEVLIVPRLHELTSIGDDMDFIGDLPLVRLRRAAYRSWGWQLKRLLDVVVSASAIALLSPVLLACALAVRIEGGRGVIFRQQRVGCDGQLFELMKFRSLRPVDDDESQTNWSIAHDDRLGPVGRFLRVTSLDELPQLFNILRGDMSLVGPRPERPHFVAQFDGLYRGYNARHRVPCGLTGWAQIHGLRGDTSISERARFDNFYIENWSLWLDIKIILRTLISIFKSPGS